MSNAKYQSLGDEKDYLESDGDNHMGRQNTTNSTSSVSTAISGFLDTIPKENIELEWTSIDYNVLVVDPLKSTIFKKSYTEKKILSNISGSAKTGQLVAIMGPSGAIFT
jgi:ABC-type multidrug transport system fused ATPase/permease subunit